MKKQFLLTTLLTLLSVTAANAANTTTTNSASPATTKTKKMADSPNDFDAFFQSENEIFHQLSQMQRAMHQLMQNNFFKTPHVLATSPAGKPTSNTASKVTIDKDNKQLVYKIKLPSGADSQVDVTVDHGALIIKTNITQKITRESGNSKSISYSRKVASQALPLPNGYDEKSLTTNIENNYLLVTLKKAA